jgi:Domain of unknown function (DUF2357)
VKVYSDLFSYLNSDIGQENNLKLTAKNRQILVIEKENLTAHKILIKQNQSVYEVGFPYLQIADIEHHDNELISPLLIEIEGKNYEFFISDEILNEESIEDKTVMQSWQKEQEGKFLDNSVALLMLLGTGCLGNQKLIKSNNLINLNLLSEYLEKFEVKNAILPLIIALEKHYQLSRKLRQITPKLRHQLRRKAELMSIGHIQEMDNYCLRDYIRRPGNTPEEKAGAKQELMGVQRYQDFNTLENKFLAYFAGQILHLECYKYQQSGAEEYLVEVKKLRQTIDIFKQQPVVKTISSRYFRLTKPNYVLQQNQIYSSFYKAYLDYVKKRSEKEKLWSFRNNLFGDMVYLCLLTAILKLQGIKLTPLTSINGKSYPDKGKYIDNQGVSIPIFLKDYVYEFRLEKTDDLSKGDYFLQIKKHDLYSSHLTTIKQDFPIWIFWYQPSESVINQAIKYLENEKNKFSLGIIFYWQKSPNISRENCEINRDNEKLWLCQIANPIDSQSFSIIINFLAAEIIIKLGDNIRE